MICLKIIRVRFHLKSGRTIQTWCSKFKAQERENDLVSFTVTDGRMPFYIRISDIEAIETREFWNWRRLFIRTVLL